MAIWSKALPLAASCLSPLPGFEPRPGQVRKFPEHLRVRWWFSLSTLVSFTTENWHKSAKSKFQIDLATLSRVPSRIAPWQ